MTTYAELKAQADALSAQQRELEDAKRIAMLELQLQESGSEKGQEKTSQETRQAPRQQLREWDGG